MNRRIRAGIAIMAFILLFAIAFGGEGNVDLSRRLMPPSAGHLFGCDTFGRDLIERTAGGILVSMSIALAVASLSMA
ncbi:MAG: ABC transporter permease, partial [Candidatus Ornithospirochaeta sp.]|nr:ABC transporter permease [Candidatus Ornithospirochaeta sp.]